MATVASDPWRFQRAIWGAEKESEESTVALEQLRKKGKFYGKMFLKTGLKKLERKTAEQGHTR